MVHNPFMSLLLILLSISTTHLLAESKALLLSEPYAVCTLPNFVKDERFLEGLKDELLDQIFYEKNNDLYKFQQVRISLWI